MTKTENFKKVQIKSSAELRSWLDQNHKKEESVWLVTFKKHIEGSYVSVQEVLDELLCFGWIDGIRRKLDEDRTMQLISPRKAQHWSKTYKDRFSKLEREGRMADAGIDAVKRSKRLGLWNFLDDVDALVKSEDLLKAFQSYPGSKKNFEAFGASSQRFMLRWLKLAKTPETRTTRIRQLASLAAENKKLPGS